MAGATHRTKVNGIWCFQFAVPQDCRAELARRYPDEYKGQKAIRRSLKTGEARAAERLARPLIDLWTARVDMVRGKRPVWEEAVERLNEMGYETGEPGVPNEDGLIPVPIAQTAQFARDLERQHARHRYASARSKLIGIPGVDPDAALAPLSREINERLSEVEKVVAVITGEAPAPTAKSDLTDLFGRWQREARPTASSIRECEYSVRRFREMFGAVPACEITKAMMREFRDAVLDAPTRISNEEAKLPFRKLLEKYKGKDVARSSLASARKRLAFIKTLLSLAVDIGMIEESPADGVRIKDDGNKPGEERKAFSFSEIEKMLSCAVSKEASFRWITTLGVYTGCRMGEIVQLTSADVQNEDGVYFLSINADGNKSTKTSSSIRRIPIHHDIINEFLIFVGTKKGRLFDDIRPGLNGDPTNLISKKWNYWSKSVGLDGRGLCFHSLRHSFKDRCREAGIGEEVHDALTGHAGGGVGRSYGGRPPLRVLAEAVAKLRFPIVLAV